MLTLVAQARDGLSNAEMRLAEIVLTRPEDVITMSMTDLKGFASVSDPTIVRFCRRFGCTGYPDFKVRLAQGLAPKPPFTHQAITGSDSVAASATKLLENSINAIRRFGEDLDPAAIEAAADRLLAAKNSFLFALGLSETVAFDAEHKLFRLGVHCRLVLDAHRQTLIAPTLRPDEAVMFFSHSGATRTLVAAAAAAHAHGTATIALTAPGSRLARLCDVVIGLPRYEDSELYTPLTARINHFLVVNMLVVAIGLKQGRAMPDNLAALEPWLTEKFVD
ncbi:MurR/RpiR family transcriptional regulator [Lichenicoccus sp.]|uniref:MurR/RpiR family transcriptional regulator n=1 Tax=Lichenicoccus sp. TaxID=2781899 RepID=UPI003D0C9D34